MKKILFILFTITAIFSAQQTVFAHTVNLDQPPVLIEKISDQLFADLKTQKQQINKNPNVLIEVVKKDLMPYVHTKYAGSLILGSYFKKFSLEEKEKFFAELSKYIEFTYAQALTLYDDQKIELNKSAIDFSKETKGVTKLKIRAGNAEPINLDFYWRKNTKTGEWQIYDLATNGVSMVTTKKADWSPVFRTKGIDAVIENMQNTMSQGIKK